MTQGVFFPAPFALLRSQTCFAFTYTTVWLLHDCWYVSQPFAGLLKGKGDLTLCPYLCEGTDEMKEGGRQEKTQRSSGAPYVPTWIYKNRTAHKECLMHWNIIYIYIFFFLTNAQLYVPMNTNFTYSLYLYLKSFPNVIISWCFEGSVQQYSGL